jgi:hypothetical protein
MANAERVQMVMADFYDKVAAGTITPKDVAMVKAVNAEGGKLLAKKCFPKCRMTQSEDLRSET